MLFGVNLAKAQQATPTVNMSYLKVSREARSPGPDVNIMYRVQKEPGQSTASNVGMAVEAHTVNVATNQSIMGCKTQDTHQAEVH